jgi:hypothetical protein
MANNVQFQIIGVAPPDAESPNWRVTLGWWNTDSDTADPPDFTIIKTAVDATSKEEAENTVGAEALEEQKELNAGDDPNPFGNDDDDDDDGDKDDDGNKDDGGDDGDDDGNDGDGDDDGGDGGGDPFPGTSVPPKERK